MTVENTNSKQIAQQMGTLSEYPFSLTVLLTDPTEEDAKKAIKAKVKQADGVEIDLIYGTDYSVSLNTDRSGGFVTVTDKRTSDDYITIYREYEETQEADYQDFNAAPAETYEQCFDKLTMICQQQQEEIDRSVKVNMTSETTPEDIVYEINRVYESIDNVDIVAGDKAAIDTVVENITDINNCADNMQAIIDAPNQAGAAASSASLALQSENNSRIWAEGTDEQVADLGGTHSSKGWAQYAESVVTGDYFLNKSQITNCLLEVPQRVKVELNDGAVTLKAGSVVIVPYGTSAPTLEIGDTLNGGEIVDISWDGSKLFYYVRYEQDKTSTFTPTSSYNDNVFALPNGAVIFRNVLNSYSGDSAPTISSNYALWYDTANNIVKQTENQGQTWENYLSLPFCIAGVTKSVGITSLENIFNGFGFIGSTVWIDKGVKALIPNGRNADGSLKNIEYTTSKIIPTQTNIGTRLYLYRILDGWETLVRSEYIYIQDEQPDAADFDYTGTNAWFSPGENYWRIYENGGWQIVPVLSYAYIDCGNTIAEFYRPVSFKTKLPFRAVDYNDTEFIAHQAMPSGTIVDLSVGASGATYKAPADGYVTVYGRANSSNDAYLDLMSSNFRYISHAYTQNTGLAITIPVAKSCIFKLSYLNINISAAYFTYANGAI